MKKLLLVALLGLAFNFYGQITILGPTFVKTYTPNTTWGGWVDDPLSNSGKIWSFPGYSGQTIVREYSNMANFISDVVAQTYTLPLGYAGTGHVVYGGYLYYNKYNSSNLVKYSLATQSVVLDVPLSGAGSMNTYAYQWGGYSDIDFAVDENGLFVIYSSAGNSGNIVISKLNPATLLPINTYSTATTKNCGNAFMAQGVNYSLANYNVTNTTLNYKYNTLTSTGTTAVISFSNGNSYLTSLVYNPTTKILFAWSNSNLYTYTVVPSNSISASVSNTAICAGATLNVNYTAAGSYTAPNTFTAQLSDGAGSFTNNPVNIGTLTSTLSGVITATIPLGTPTGTAYRIRVSANNPGIIGENNGSNINISGTPTVNIVATSTAVCSGASATLTASGAATYSWSNGSVTATTVVSPTANAVYTVVGSNTLGCGNTVTQSVNVTPGPTVSIAGASTLCSGSSIVLTASGANTYSWNTGATTASISTSPTANVTYTAIGTSTVNGCSTMAFQSVTVNAVPTVSITGPSTVCVGGSLTLTASGANTYSWNTGGTTSSIVVSPSVNTTYTAIGTSAEGCTNTATAAIVVDPCTGIMSHASVNGILSVYPNPNNGEFTIELKNNFNKAIEITDLTGRVILTTSSEKEKINVNIHSFANGIYYVKVKSNGTTDVFKVVKQ